MTADFMDCGFWRARAGYDLNSSTAMPLSELTGFRFLHGHMTAEPVAALSGWGTPAYAEALTNLQLSLLAGAVEQDGVPSIVFTSGAHRAGRNAASPSSEAGEA